jgi:hypothetical protein
MATTTADPVTATIIAKISDPELQAYVMRCVDLIPRKDVYKKSTQVPSGISQNTFFNSANTLPLFRLVPSSAGGKQTVTITNQPIPKGKRGVQCALVRIATNSGNLKTVFPSANDANNPNLACMYCTYLQIFGEPAYAPNACAITACTKSLFSTRQQIPGNENATRDTSRDACLATAEATAQVAGVLPGAEAGVLELPEDAQPGTGAGIDDPVIQAIEKTVLQTSSDNDDVEELRKRLREAEAVVSEIQKQLEKAEANKRARNVMGDASDLPDFDAFNNTL